MDDAIAVVLGGGRGARLFPLTQYRSKPAVPIGASYRLVDVAVSNCIHANLRRIFVITQYQSESLNRHVANTYKFDAFASGFIEVLVAEQTDSQESDWFGGTADAVRKTMKHLAREAWDHLLILSGDQLYRMNLDAMLRVHRERSAAVTVAMKAVPAELTQGLGIMKVDPSGRVVHFDEKPPPERLPRLASTPPGVKEPVYLASMGIYAFTRKAVAQAIENAAHIDFGHHVLPSMLSVSHVQAYLYDGYWEDVGTVRSYFEANLALTQKGSAFNFYHPRYPIYTERPFLAPTQFYSCHIHDALIADGCFLDRVEIDHAVIGVRSRIGAGVTIKNSLVLGADEYETAVEDQPGLNRQPPLGIADNSSIENAIIDKNARIGKNVRIQNADGVRHHDGDGYFIRDGIVIVPKGGVIPDGTVI
ncbi:MAG TPA: sugar phosphate nucleotidyltransferase [Polyangiaceae bacterium]|jgi:glucose-1-phosphate adenylyltransferase|nr:sugar phosphate nucleotidyltransferase [Polyangiaceae bacterium]